jgi:N-acetylglucosaminyldiphosphoundecaprenol N-acetyl-beta-D-mannosaminyltransferase
MTEIRPAACLFGIKIDAIRMTDVLTILDDAIKARQKRLIGVVNAAKVVKMRGDELLNDSVRKADLILADGMSVVWASRLLGQALPERIPGIDLMTQLLEQGSHKGYRIYFLGASEEVLSKVLECVGRDYPGVVIAGSHHGYFTEEDEPRLAESIRSARADVIFVAMTSPKKEVFLNRWFDSLDVSVCHGVGGSFDVMAGKVKRAPEAWQRWGMEWLYRVVQEPGRMWRRYLVTNTLFCGIVLKELFTSRRSLPAEPLDNRL